MMMVMMTLMLVKMEICGPGKFSKSCVTSFHLQGPGKRQDILLVPTMLPTAASGVMMITKKMIVMNTTTMMLMVISMVYNHRKTTRVDFHLTDLINKCSASPSSSSLSIPPPTKVLPGNLFKKNMSHVICKDYNIH